MKKILTITLVIAFLCAALAGCGQQAPAADAQQTDAAQQPADAKETAITEEPSKDEGAAGSNGQNYKFGLTIQTLDNNHWLRLIEGVKSSLREGDELVTLNAEYDTNKQITQLEDLIAQECDVIFYVAVDGAAIRPGLQSCKEAGIPAIAIDIEADSRDETAAVAVTDNYQAGLIMGEAFLKETGGEAKVGLLGFTAVAPARLREEAFRATIEGQEGVEIVTYQEAFPNTEDALPVLENMLQAKPEITDFVCINDLQALGAIQVCKAQNRPDIRIYAVDGNPDAVKFVMDGKMIGTSAQFPNKEGSTAVEIAYKMLAGEEYEVENLVPCEWINKDNGQEYLDMLGEG